jgi:hypothetical protein
MLSLFCLFLLSCEESKPPSIPDEPIILRTPDSLRYQTALWTSDRIHREVQNGDVLLKRGEGSISRIVVSVLEEEMPISHTAIVIRTLDTLYLIHSMAGAISHSDGVQGIPMDSFLLDCRDYSLHILRHKDKEVANKASEIAQYYLSIRVPFDTDYILEDDTSGFYCSEFVHKTWEDASGTGCFELSNVGMGQILNFNSILEHPDFELINRRGSDTDTVAPIQKG